jgi:hypothetical protein
LTDGRTELPRSDGKGDDSPEAEGLYEWSFDDISRSGEAVFPGRLDSVRGVAPVLKSLFKATMAVCARDCPPELCFRPNTTDNQARRCNVKIVVKMMVAYTSSLRRPIQEMGTPPRTFSSAWRIRRLVHVTRKRLQTTGEKVDVAEGLQSSRTLMHPEPMTERPLPVSVQFGQDEILPAKESAAQSTIEGLVS